MLKYAGRGKKTWPCWLGPKHPVRNRPGPAAGATLQSERNAGVVEIHWQPQVTHNQGRIQEREDRRKSRTLLV